MTTKPWRREGGGWAKGLSGRATKKRIYFCGFPYPGIMSKGYKE